MIMMMMLKSEASVPQWRSPCQSDEDKCAFIDAIVLFMYMRLLYENYHNGNKARESITGLHVKKGNHMRGELVSKFSTERA